VIISIRELSHRFAVAGEDRLKWFGLFPFGVLRSEFGQAVEREHSLRVLKDAQSKEK
jgi:hypothetical protein